MGPIWFLAMLVIAVYCICQAVRDFRRGERAMGLFGAVCAGFILFMPIKTHAVKIDLPIATGSR
ncbi:MAG: hypothetical protein P0Y59_15855 [Candidatus Sphingomonas phytovorans]|nr:hypothetical protein [Sphingomonas sp.]WEJ98413.1 MAG: hypothetical protein P0Y59_15855 [Sphingomonas sp.]